MTTENQVAYPLTEAVDFVIVGSGSAGGILAKELSTDGFSVVVLEQGPFREAKDFTHDEFAVFMMSELAGGAAHKRNQTSKKNT